MNEKKGNLGNMQLISEVNDSFSSDSRAFACERLPVGSRILITGAAGFLGSHLCHRLVNEGMDVIGMDNLVTGDLKNIEELFKLENFEFYHHDVSNFIHVPGKLDYILHFASPASPIDYLKIPIQTLKVSSLGTHNCLGLALSKNARMFMMKPNVFRKQLLLLTIHFMDLRSGLCGFLILMAHV